MKRKININFRTVVRTYLSNLSINFSNSKHVIQEGSSRSGKTISDVDFIIWYCLKNTGKVIFCIRNTYASHKTTLYNDFHSRLKAFNLPSPFDNAREVQMFQLNGNSIYFLGGDKPDKFEGAGCDIAYFNEILDQDQIIFDQVEQRCREMMIGDYNPKYTIHWVYDKILKRNDVVYLHSTFSDNPFLSPNERKKILSYDPSNPLNVEQGTADDYRWNVYGLGKRFAPTGMIFPRVTWINEFPEEVERIFFGLDFGKTVDPSALVKCGVNGRNLYVQEYLYTPTETPEYLYDCIKEPVNNNITWADLAEPIFIGKLNEYGLNVYAAKKFAGCIKYRTDLMNTYNIHIVKTPNFVKEIENYTKRSINGIIFDEPDPHAKNNHLIDAMGYACQHELSIYEQ